MENGYDFNKLLKASTKDVWFPKYAQLFFEMTHVHKCTVSFGTKMVAVCQTDTKLLRLSIFAVLKTKLDA